MSVTVSMIRNESEAVKHATCKICGPSDASIQYIYNRGGSTFDIVKCSRCGHLYVDPVPLESPESRTMDTLVDAEFDGNNFLKSLHVNLVIKREINCVKRVINKDNPKLLDVGCGTGWTTSIWQKEGFQVTGLEPSRSRCEYGRENYNLNIVNGLLEDLEGENKYDVIVLRHVLEHIEDPGDFLTKLKNNLNEEGVILITIPNINSIGRYIFKENWEWVLPWHLHFFYPKTLKALVNSRGFETLKLYQMPSPLWYPSSIGRYFGEKSRVSKLLSRYAKLWALILVSPLVLSGMALGLNDNMTLIARKNPG